MTDRIGPYELGSPLGRGGMGVVYRARDVRDGRSVALKTVLRFDERLVWGLRREISALSRLHHPGIVAIHESGDHEGLPWYAMDLLRGKTLRQLAGTYGPPAPTAAVTAPGLATTSAYLHATLRDTDQFGSADSSADDPDPVGQIEPARDLLPAITWVHRLCAPLAYLHGEGLAHRDLKPDNILFVDDERPVLVDFGLLSHFAGSEGREALAFDARSHGTASYLAPEIIRGEGADARADLYALGVILYELITGRLPFRSPQVASLLYQHLEATPQPPSARVAGVPRKLDDLVMRLLAKAPEDRIGYAEDVRRILGDLGAPPDPTTGPPAQTYLYRARLAGRTSELEMARNFAAVRPLQGALIIEGEAGIGRTRFLLEVGRRALQRGCAVLAVALDASGTQDAIARIGDALADRAIAQGADRAACWLGPVAGVLAHRFPRLAPFAAGSSPSPLPAAAARAREADALLHALSSWGDDRPTLLLIDDLHWADDFVVELAAAAEKRRPHGVAVLASTLSDGVHQTVATLPRATLRRLDTPAQRDVVTDMLGFAEPPTELLRFVAGRSEGVPMFIVELLRGLVDHELLSRDASGRWRLALAALDPSADRLFAGLGLPESLRDLMDRRLADLPGDARIMLAALALLATEAHTLLVADVGRRLGLGRQGAADALDLLLRRHLVTEREGHLRTAHGELRERIIGDLTAAERKATHAAIADALEESAEPVAPARLAQHLEFAEEVARSESAWRSALARGTQAYALDDVEAALRGLMRTVPVDGPEQSHLATRLSSDVLAPRGRTGEANAVLDRELRAARARGDTAGEIAVLLHLAALTAQIGRNEDVAHLLAAALSRLDTAPDAWAETQCRIALARHCIASGHLGAAESEIRSALRLARRSKDRTQEGVALVVLAEMEVDREHPDVAADLIHKALRRLEPDAPRGVRADGLSVLARSRRLLGRHDEAIGLFDDALAIVPDDAVRSGQIRCERAATLAAGGSHRLALTEFGTALGQLREAGHLHFQARALRVAGRCHATAGDPKTAAVLLDQAAMLAQVLGDAHGAAACRVESADAQAASRPDRALHLARQAFREATDIVDDRLAAQAVALWSRLAPAEAAPHLRPSLQKATVQGDMKTAAFLHQALGADQEGVGRLAMFAGAWEVLDELV